jgi:hypothetical protein
MEKAFRDKFLKILAILFFVGMIVKIAIIVYSGKMYVLWYNTVLVVCVLMVAAVIGFWVYGAIKGFDNVFKDEIRGGE